MNAGLIHFYSKNNVGDAAIHAALEKLVGSALTDHDFDDAQAARKRDLLISVGGDIFNNARPRLMTRRLLSKFKQLRWAPEKTILFGQSIPPSCDGIAFRLLAHHLRKIASVSVRDPLSHERLRSVGVNADLTVDSVFALEGKDADVANARELYAAHDLDSERTAVFSIRNFGRMYPIAEGEFQDRIVRTMQRLRELDFQIAVLLQADVDDNDSDRALANRLKTEIPSLKILDPFRADSDPWRVALGVVAIAKTVVGTRFHTNIFRMVSGGMPVGLWYSNKGEDLNTRFGVPGADAAVFNPDEIAFLAEQAANQPFDPLPLHAQVNSDFNAAMLRVRSIGERTSQDAQQPIGFARSSPL